MLDIAVVIPTKDRLQYLRKAVPMFLEYREVREVIVVVDGCKDGTLDYVKAISASDNRVKYTDNVINRGLPYSRNRGIELAESEFVFTGEDDLELAENFFAMLFTHMLESGADIISGRNIFKFEHEDATVAVQRANSLAGSAVDRKMIAVQTGINVPGDQPQLLLPAPMLANAEVFRKVRFDDSYLANAWREESDFQLSAHALGYRLVFCPHAISFNIMIDNDRGGVHESGRVRRVIWMVRNNWRFIRKHRMLIAREFRAGNHYLYITRFAITKIVREIILPTLIMAKRRWLR
jgi:glycosyltransferase involved in cell wall biosynthesis